MTDMRDVSVKLTNYKCFGEKPQGFDSIMPVNVLIGRNNCGKSSLLDLIDYVSSPKDLDKIGHKGKNPTFTMTLPLSEDILKKVFKEGIADESGIIGDHWEFGKTWIRKKIEVLIRKDSRHEFIRTYPPLEHEGAKEYFVTVAEKITPFENKKFRLLRSERNIRPEKGLNSMLVDQNGKGATNIIERFINDEKLPTDLVRETMLKELNKIMEPDSSFNDISVQQFESNDWEIFLKEENKGRIALSQSGSGLKTVLLVLINSLLIPNVDDSPLYNYIFAFEELENNLHPALQRRLFLYLRNLAVEKNTIFFFTTHSNVVIDLFSGDDQAQLYHIEHDGNEANIRAVKTYIEKAGIIDDLDIRASDLLQSNGVIWVEGPSDRRYINKWIEIWSEGKIKEGAHYQCIFYGGRLLAHLSAEPPDNREEDPINILLTNRNAIIIMDSDKRSESQEINGTKKRIRKEINDGRGFCWITAGKEIEHYIPASVLRSYYKDKEISNERDIYTPFHDYLDTIKEGEGNRYSSKKVLFAAKIIPLFSKENLSDWLDLGTQIDKVIENIKRWNHEN
ncbi:MAG: ATP-binding protein [Halobacteriota archaeon]